MHRELRLANRLVIFFIGISILLLSLPLSVPVASFKASLQYLIDPGLYQGADGLKRISEIPLSLRNLLSADIQNRELKDEIKMEPILNTEIDSLKIENDRLRSEMDLGKRVSFSFVWGQVIQRSPADWYQDFIISAGKNKGLELNDPVFAVDGNTLAAVGRVLEVHSNTAVVQLLTSDLSAIDSFIVSQSSHTHGSFNGLIQGSDAPNLQISYLPVQAPLEEGEKVYTSPNSVSFPPSILIGTVVKVYPVDPFLIFKSADVRPALSPSEINEVLVGLGVNKAKINQ